jgi:prevent-host-death family protein
MQVSVAEARNNLSNWLKRVEDKPVVITRRGHPVGVLVSYVEYENLRRLRAWLQMMRLSQDLRHSGVTATELFRWSRDELEERS